MARYNITKEEFNALMLKSQQPQTEHDLQVLCVRWFREHYPNLARLLVAVPNGGYRPIKTAVYLKAEGEVSGIPDLVLFHARGEYHGLMIEMKNGKKGRISEHQSTMIELLRQQGYRVEVCRDFERFKDIIFSYLT